MGGSCSIYQSSKIDPESVPVKWKVLPTKAQANINYMKENNSFDANDRDQIEFRTLLEYPSAQETLLKFIKSGQIPQASKMEFTYYGLVELLAFNALPLDNQREKAAYALFMKFFNKNDHIDKEIREQTSLAIKRAVADSPFVYRSIFEPIQGQLFQKLYQDAFVPFKQVVQYRDLCERLKMEYNRIRPKDFAYLRVLGKGGFGMVCEVRKKSTGVHYAMKVQSKKGVTRQFGNEGWRMCLEPMALASCHHPFIVQLHCAFQTPALLVMVTELADYCDLAQLLKYYGAIPPSNVCFYAAEVVSALSYLHHKEFVHRDLKPANVLLNSNGHITLTDFGALSDLSGTTIEKCRPLRTECMDTPLFALYDLVDDGEHKLSSYINSKSSGSQGSYSHSHSNSMPLSGMTPAMTNGSSVDSSDGYETISIAGPGPGELKRAHSVIGTGRYMAPEMVILMEGLGFAGNAGYTEAVDWWALGVLIFQLLTNKMPFAFAQMDAEQTRIPRWVDLVGYVDFSLLPIESEAEKAATVDFVSQLLMVDDTKRLGFGEHGSVNVAKHAYFQAIDWAALELKECTPPPVPVPPVPVAEGGHNSCRTATTGHTGSDHVTSPVSGSNRDQALTTMANLHGINLHSNGTMSGLRCTAPRTYESLEHLLAANNRSDWLTFGSAHRSVTRQARESDLQGKLTQWDYTSPEAIASELQEQEQEQGLLSGYTVPTEPLSQHLNILQHN